MRAGCLLRQRDDAQNPLLRDDWRAFEGASRTALMVALQQRLPPSLMLPERRLEVLVEQALHSQVRLLKRTPSGKARGVHSACCDSASRKKRFREEPHAAQVAHGGAGGAGAPSAGAWLLVGALYGAA